jgi:hypothetical protein
MTVEARRPRPRRSRRRALAVFIALELLAVGALSVASAAQLTVSSSAVGVFSDTRCNSATLSVHVSPTGWSIGQNKSAVQITNFPDACFTRTTEVAVTNSAGTLIASGSATCGTTTCTITTGNYNATSATDAHVLVSTWGVPASWDSTCTIVLGFLMTCT